MVTKITSEWKAKYNTNKNAKPVEWREVKNAYVVRIVNGHLRGSNFDGVFEIADESNPITRRAGKQRVQVKVGWFGMKPKTTWSHVTLNGEWELIRNYSSEVVHNLSA